MTEHYDVIIIGSGAGGGTLAHTLAGSGKSILLLERGDFLPREMDNWDPRPVFVDGKYISTDTWFDDTGKPFQPQVHYFVGGATKMYGAALYRLRPADFGEIKHVDGISPAWPLGYDDFEPWYSRAEQMYQVHGNGGEDPTEGPRSEPYPWPAVSHEPRIQQIHDGLAKGGWHPFHAPCGIMLDEADRPRQHLHPLHLVRRLPVPGARQVRRRGDRGPAAAGPAQRHAGHRGRGDQAGDRPLRPDGHRGGRGTGRRPGGLHRRHRGCLRRRGQQRQDAAQLGQRRPPDRAGERVGPGRAQLHVPQLQGGRGPGQRAQRHGLPEDAGDQRLLLPHQGLRLAGRQHPDDRQVQRRGHARRKAHADQAVPGVDPVRRGQARGGLLAHHRGPAHARTTGSPPTPTATSTWPTPRPTTTRPSACTASCARS